MSASREVASTDGEIWPHLGGAVRQFHVLSGRLGDGLLLGTTRNGKPAKISLLRPAPVRIVVVEQGWVASLLVLRAAALGATAVVSTTRPAPWTKLVQSVGGTVPFATVAPPESLRLPAAGAAEPLFVLVDGSTGVNDPGIARGPWHTSLHLCYRLTAATSSLVDTADLILLPRPSDETMSLTLEQLRLPAGIAAQLARMGPQDLLAVTRAKATFVTVHPMRSEIEVLR